MKTENLIAVLSASVVVTGAALSSQFTSKEQPQACYKASVTAEKPVT